MQRISCWFSLLLLGLLSWLPKTGLAQAGQYKVVLEMTSDKAEVWNHTLNHIENVRRALGKDKIQIQVVCHGGGLSMLKKSHVGADANRMREQAQDQVVFVACENTMKKQKVSSSDLHPFVGTVDSGVAELVRKQTQGWSYIREI